MQRILAIVSALVLAGCMTPDGGDAPDDTNSTMPDSPIAAPPSPIEDSQTVTGSGDPINLAGAPPCSAPTAQCVRYPFTANTTVMVVADLTWTLPASDFDFYVLDSDGAPALNGASDISAGPGTSEHIEGELPEGDYEIVVVPWSVAQDTYTLSATFTLASAGNATADANSTLRLRGA